VWGGVRTERRRRVGCHCGGKKAGGALWRCGSGGDECLSRREVEEKRGKVRGRSWRCGEGKGGSGFVVGTQAGNRGLVRGGLVSNISHR